MATQGKILVYKREAKKGVTFTYRIEAGRDPITGKRRQVTKSGFKSAKEARAAAQPILNKLLLGENIIESDITFTEYTNEWFEEYKKHIKDSTKVTIKSYLKHALNYFGNKKLKDITPYNYQKFLNSLTNKLTSKTLHSVDIYTKNIFDTAFRYNIIRNNPCVKITFPKSTKIVKAKSIEEMFLEKEELQDFLHLIQDDKNKYMYYMIITLAYTGMRLGELCALTWNNVFLNDAEKSIYVDSNLYGLNYKTVKREKTPKNLSSIRTILIDKFLTEKLNEWRKIQIEARIKHATQEKRPVDDFVFTVYSKRDGREYPFLPNDFKNRLAKIVKNTPYKYIHAHIFRHTHVSLLAEAGVPLEIIQERLGHSTSEITKKVYLHVTKKSKINAAQKFEKYMSI